MKYKYFPLHSMKSKPYSTKTFEYPLFLYLVLSFFPSILLFFFLILLVSFFLGINQDIFKGYTLLPLFMLSFLISLIWIPKCPTYGAEILRTFVGMNQAFRLFYIRYRFKYQLTFEPKGPFSPFILFCLIKLYSKTLLRNSLSLSPPPHTHTLSFSLSLSLSLSETSYMYL